MPITEQMLDALDRAGPEARRQFFAKRTEAERAELATAIPTWRANRSRVATKPQISGMESAARGGLQGLTADFADEAQAGIAAGLQGLTNLLPDDVRNSLDLVKASAGDAYRQTRDMDRGANKAAEEANPSAYHGAEIAGSVASMAVPGLGAVGKSAKTLGGAMKAGAILGGAAGLGNSEADLLSGQALLDTGVGALAGAGGGALGHGIASGIGGIGRRLSERAARGVASADEAIQRIGQMKGMAPELSARSTAGNTAQAAYRSAEKALADPNAPPDVVQMARALLDEMNAKGTANVAGDAASKKAGAAAYSAAREQTPELIAAATKEAGDPMRVVKRLAKRYAVPAIGGLVGTAIGGPVGLGVGALAGRGVSPSVNAVIRAMKEPAMRKAGWQVVQAIAGKPESKALGKFAPLLARAAAKGEGELKLLHAALLEKVPEYAAALARMVSDDEEAEPVAAVP